MESPLRTSSPLETKLPVSVQTPEVDEEYASARSYVEEAESGRREKQIQENITSATGPIIHDHDSDGHDYDREDDQERIEEPKTEVPLLPDDEVRIDVQSEEDDNGDNTATLPLKKGDPVEESKKKPPLYLFPITRMKLAWTSSETICEFFVKAVFIIFSTLGWLFCVGGIPFVSIAMLVIGAVYKNDCSIRPQIPVYLIVAGVFGTLQHVLSLYTRYIPKDSKGRARKIRAYCNAFDGTIHLFNMIWFVLGCIWVYGVYGEVDYLDSYKDEYCHKTLYLFAFWMLNFSFIVLAMLMVCGLGCILCIVVATPKDEGKGSVQ